MKNNQHVYQSEVLGLPPLRMVLGEIPEPDGEKRRHSIKPFNVDATLDAKDTVQKLIGHLKKSQK